MEEDDQRPKTKPAGARPPPAPPRRTAVGLGSAGDDPDKKRQVTITKAADGEGKFIRQSGGVVHHGHVIIKVEPNGRGKGVIIHNDVPNSTIPEKYIRLATDGIREVLDHGILDDERPIVDIIVRIVGGSSDQSASSDLAFKMAGIFCIKDAIKKAEPLVIE